MRKFYIALIAKSLVWIVNNIISLPLSIVLFQEQNMHSDRKYPCQKMWKVVKSKLAAFFMNIENSQYESTLLFLLISLIVKVIYDFGSWRINLKESILLHSIIRLQRNNQWVTIKLLLQSALIREKSDFQITVA